MTGPRARPSRGARAAVLAGWLAGFVCLVDLVRLVRLPLLIDPDPSWAVARLLLGLGVAAAAGAGGVLAAAAFALWAADSRSCVDAAPLPFRWESLALLAAGALLAGAAARFVGLGRVPAWLFLDDVSLLDPTLALAGSWRDFSDAVRPVPFGVAKLFGTVGVVYLEGFRLALKAFGTTVFGLRFLSALAGAVSIVTAGLLARTLLPRGAGALAALVVAGLRWHLILSRWGWSMIVLVPLVDVATLLVIRARRRRGVAAAGAAGAVAGLGAHVYLAGWVAAAALTGFCLWPCSAEPTQGKPGARDDAPSARLRRALLFGAGFLLAVAPLFLFREGRAIAYFARTGDHNVLREFRYRRSVEPLFAAAADALVAPWIIPDPTPRHDLPGRSRLGWILGIPVLAVFARALLKPREEVSGLLLAHGGAALAATLVAGEAGNPNGARFAYLTTVTAVAVAAGVQLLLGAVPPARRHAAALAAVGLLAVAGALGVRDALVIWPERPETFSGFHGMDTLIGRAAARWERFGQVEVARGLGHSPVTIDGVRRYRLDPDPAPTPAVPPRFNVRIVALGAAAVAPETKPAANERLVERVVAPGGRTIGLVFARKAA